MLFLGTYRSDETAGSAFLKIWKELQPSTTSALPTARSR